MTPRKPATLAPAIPTGPMPPNPATAPVKHPAEVAKLKAEADEATANAEAARAEARKATAEAQQYELALRESNRAIDIMLADDDYHHTYRFNDVVTAPSVEKCMRQLQVWVRLAGEDKLDIELILNSPGGSVISGMALWDFLTGLRNDGHKITTVSRGMAASMAGILLQAGDIRVMGKESYLLIHEVSSGISGSMGEIEDEVEFLKKIQQRIIGIFADRSNLTKAEIGRKWKRKDWWLDSDEAIKLGFADVVR